MTYADLLRPSIARYALLYDTMLVAGGSILVALSAQICIPVPFSPIPITGQTLSVLLLGALLGSRRGALSLAAYLAEGASGWPVFSGASGGLVHLTGPTAGYLAGFVPAAFLTGLLAERGWDRTKKTALAAMVLGNAVIYAFGLAWLGLFTGAGRVLSLGLTPFLAGDLLKVTLAACLLPVGWKLIGRRTER